EYQSVLKDLLSLHPYAKSWGLGPDSPLLELDTGGVVLWYLSDTLLGNTSEVEVTPPRMPPMFLQRVFSDTLTDVTPTADSKRTMWPGGPTRLRVYDAMAETLMQTPWNRELGFD